jgi:hypothetical protein
MENLRLHCWLRRPCLPLKLNVFLSNIYPRSELRIYWCYFSLSSQHISAPSGHLQVKYNYITYIFWENYRYYKDKIEVEVNLPPTVSRPVCPGVSRLSETRDQFFFLLATLLCQIIHFSVEVPQNSRPCFTDSSDPHGLCWH